VADPFFRVALIAMGALTTFWGFGNFFPSWNLVFYARPFVKQSCVHLYLYAIVFHFFWTCLGHCPDLSRQNLWIRKYSCENTNQNDCIRCRS
jgi:hypothetical protein